MRIKDFMTKENLEMIGLAVMCDRWSYLWRDRIEIIQEPYGSASYNNFKDMVSLGKDITVIMEFFETLDGECRIKDVSEYLKENDIHLSIQRITAVCRRLCANGFLKQRYSDPYEITVRDMEWCWDNYPRRKEVIKKIEVKDSLYSLA